MGKVIGKVVQFINFITSWSMVSIYACCMTIFKEFRGEHADANMYFILVFVFCALGKLDSIRKHLGVVK